MTAVLQRFTISMGSGSGAALQEKSEGAIVARQEQAGIKQLSIVRLRMIFEASQPEDPDPCRMSGLMSARIVTVRW